MIDKVLLDITAGDLLRLVEDSVQEGRTLEFKRELPGPRESDRKEFLADVSSFANALGGDLVYGVSTVQGRAHAAEGLSVENLDAELLRLDQMIRSGISPRITGFQIQAITALPAGPAIIIRVPRSWQGPHIVSYQQHFRFYSRNANGKFPMDATDVRDAVLNSANTEERIRTFRSDRLARIVAGETPVSLGGTKLVCLHVVPFQAYAGTLQVDLLMAANRPELLEPLSANGWSGPRFNIDGVFVDTALGATAASGGYVQLLRNGTVEAVDALMIPSPPPYPDAVPSLAFAEKVFAFGQRIGELLRILDVAPPGALLVSVLGAKGIELAVSQHVRMYQSLRPIDRNVLMLPEVVLEQWSFDPKVALKAVLDGLWQAAGAPRCFDYDDQGHWKPHR